MNVGDRISVSVTKIANGFLVREERNAEYKTACGEYLFYPDMVGVERELVVRLRAANALDVTNAEVHF